MMTSDKTEQYLRIDTVMQMTGVGRSYAYDHDEFPKPYRLGRRMVGWKRTEIEAWMASRPHARDGIEAS